MSDKTIGERLAEIQANLVCPKSQFNEFAKFKYRSTEDVLSAVKPLLDGLILHMSDEVVEVGGRVYVKATATLSSSTNRDHLSSATAFAREPDQKKGMDSSQITGTASSYARKYALCGLFMIDDGRDADAMRPKETKDEKNERLIKGQGAATYVVAIVELLDADDGSALFDVVGEMTNKEKLDVWPLLASHQRSKLTRMIDAQKAAIKAGTNTESNDVHR